MKKTDANVDLISGQGGALKASGSVGMRMLETGFNVNALRTNDTLRKDEWKHFDTALVEVARKRMPLVNLLTSMGLTYNLSDGLGTTILEWEDVSDFEPAHVSMAGVTEGETDALEFDLHSMPLPIIHKGFNINIRKLHASRKLGQPLDTAQLEFATRKVAEQTESMIVAGHATRVGSSRIYGIDTVPNSSAVTMTNNWDSTTAAAEYVANVQSAIAALQADYMYGPYVLMVNYATHNRLMNDYDVAGASLMTIAERLLKLKSISQIIPSTDVPANHAYVVQLTRDVIDEVVGMQPTVVQWDSHGGMMQHFKVMSIMIPRVRYTQTLQSGIAIIS